MAFMKSFSTDDMKAITNDKKNCTRWWSKKSL